MRDMTIEKTDPNGGCPEVAIAAGRLLGCLRNINEAEAGVVGFKALDLQKVWEAMRKDHAENQHNGMPADWPSTFIAGLEALLEEAAPRVENKAAA